MEVSGALSLKTDVFVVIFEPSLCQVIYLVYRPDWDRCGQIKSSNSLDLCKELFFFINTMQSFSL